VGKEALATTPMASGWWNWPHSLTAALLPSLIASALALAEQPGQTLLETLVAALQNKQMLSDSG